MLQSMRAMAQSWIVKGLMALLIVSFGIWGIGDMFRGNALQKAVAHVGDDTITVAQLEQAFKRALPEAREVFGPQLTETEARQVGVLDRTLGDLVQESLLRQEIKRLGLNVSNKTIMATLADKPELQDKNGNFDLAQWKRIVSQSGRSEQTILDNERAYEGRKILLGGLVDGIETPQLILNDLYRAQGDRRVLQVLVLPNESFKDVPAPDDKALHAFYDKEAEAFTAPEYRAITVATLSSEAILKNIAPSDEALKQMYAARQDQLKQPEKRDIVQVVLQDESKATTLAASVPPGGDLAKVAKAKGLTSVPIKGVDNKSIMPELYTSVFALEEGQVSPPLHSSMGWHVVQVKKIHPAGVPPFEAVRDELRESAKNEDASGAIARVVGQLDDELAAGHALEDIADTLKLRLVRYPAVDSHGNAAEGGAPKEFPSKDEVLKTAFEQASGDVSSVMEDGKGNYFVVRTDDIRPSARLPFDAVKAKVTNLLLEKARAEVAVKKADEIVKALQADPKKSLSDYAAMQGAKFFLSKPLSFLDDKDTSLPKSVIARALLIKKGDVQHLRADGKEYIYRLSKIEPIDLAQKNAPGREKIADELKERLPVDILKQYMDHLKRSYRITYDDALLDSLKKRDGN